MRSKISTPPRKLLTKVFNDLLDEYVTNYNPLDKEKNPEAQHFKSDILDFDQEKEIRSVINFLTSSCKCGQNCQMQFTQEELLESRRDFRFLSWHNYALVRISPLWQHQRELDREGQGKDLSTASMRIVPFVSKCFYSIIVKPSGD